MLPSEITTTMEYSDPDHPLANGYIRTWKQFHSTAKEDGKDIDEKEYRQEVTAFDKPLYKRIRRLMDGRITMKDVETAFGVRKTQAYDLIKHPSRMNREQVAKLATLLDVTLAELRGEPQVLMANTVATYYDHLTETDKAMVSSLITRLHSADHEISWM